MQGLTCRLTVKNCVVDFCSKDSFDQAEFWNGRPHPSDCFSLTRHLIHHADNGRRGQRLGVGANGKAQSHGKPVFDMGF